MAKSSTPNSSNYSYNIVSNRENLDETKKKIIDDIKFDLFETMKIDELMVNRNILSDSIGKNRYENRINGKNEGIPGGTIVLKDGLEIDLGNKYSDLMNEYKRLIKDKPEGYESELKKLDTKLAERLTLDKGFAIEFKSNDKFDDGKNSEEEAKIAYDGLNELKDYKGKIDLVSKKKDNIDYFVIKWKPNQLEKIKLALNVINAVLEMKGQEAEKLQKDSDDNKKTIEELTKKLNEIDNKQVDDGDKNNKKDEESDKNIKVEENKKDSENKAENNEKEEFLRRLKEYCPWLFEGQDKRTTKKEDSETTESNRESIEENALYVSRHDVELSVAHCRVGSEFPVGKVEIKGTYVNVEEFEFYEEIKQEYILAKGDVIKLAELDKKLAELIILCSPRGVAVEQRYQIRLTQEEIIAGGLVVSQDFLARYGLAVDYFEYTNTIIEREYQERIETVKKIETEITELTRVIAELTTRINIEKYSSEKILEEIRVKKERVRILKERLYALLISLRKTKNGGNEKPDEDLLALKDLEKRLMAELDELKKEKEHQEEVNNRIKELKEKMWDHESWNKLRWLMNEKSLAKNTLNQLESEEADLAKAEKEKEDELAQFASDLAPEEINRLTNEYYEIQKERAKKQEEIKKLQNRIAEIDKEIENNSSYKKWQEISNILDSIADDQTISIITHDGKKCVLSKKGDYFEKKLNQTELFDGETPNKDKLLIALDTDKIQKIIIGESSQNPQEILLSDEQKLKDELEKLKAEQAGFDKDIDQKIANKEKKLADVRNQIKNKETKRVVLAEFDDGDNGANFYDYCGKNGIKRKDGKDIPLTGGLDTSAIYIDKAGRELKLEPTEMSNGDGYDKPIARYELVYYEKSESTGTSEIEQELRLIIQEQQELYMELEELEHKLTIEKSEFMKIEIEKQINIIQKKLTIIKRRITEITNITKTYKETITQYKYRVYRVRPVLQQSFEMTSVISDMGTDVFREKASLKVEEDLKAYYKSLGRWQVGSRLALFLGRGRRRKRMIRNEMNNMANTAFQTGAGYDRLNDQSQNAADRHKHELDNNMEAINQIARVHNPHVDQLCKNYLNNAVNDDQFQQQFNQIIANDANIQNILNGQSITHIGTNILLRLQEQKAFNQLILTMDAQLAHYIATGNQVYMDNMRNFVSQFIKDYQKTPVFMANFEQFVNGDLNARNRLKLYLNHQKQVMQMQITNLRMNIDILNKGKSAYQIDNKDRETGKGSWKFKLGHFMDKHPRGTAIASTAISVGIGLGTGLIASPVVAGAVSLGLFGGLVGTTNAVKKWTHHTKEQNTHEKNVATDYRNEQAKIQAWQNEALHGHGWRKYKAKRQLALYDQTTQENIKLSDQITEYITNLSSKVGPLTADEDNFMRCNLIEGWARLKYYRQMGHNFLASEQVDSTEKDMKRLEKAITLGLQKIGKTTNDIEHNMNATNQLGTNITYAVIQNDLKASYDKSLIQFKRERRNLSLKYGFGTAIASIGVGAFFQWITHSGIFAQSTPPTAPTTTTHSGGTDNFGLGKDEVLLPGEAGYVTNPTGIHDTTVTAISGAPNGSTVNFMYGVGTDATPVIPGSLTSGDLTTKINGIKANINAMSWPTAAAKSQRDAFITELESLVHSGFTNDNLATMRAAEYLEHCARAVSDVGNDTLIPTFTSHAFDASGGTYNKLAERFMTSAIDITTPGTPGKEAVRRGRWFMGLPLFFNTFKDRKETTDTTDQNFGRGNNQQPNRPNNQQPNRPQVNPNRPNNP